jgi:hypothetical protein
MRAVQTLMTTTAAPFWGTRYQVRRQPYGKSGSIYAIVDTLAIGREPTVSIDALRGHAQAEADKLNADPSANYNGQGWPKVHYGNIWDPEEDCDCRDSAPPYPKPEGWMPSNICGSVVGTFCKTHGGHDGCPRSVRGVNLTTDPQFVENRVQELERRYEDLARTEEFLEKEAARVARLQRLSERYA